MSCLKLKVPPVALFLFISGLMWFLSDMWLVVIPHSLSLLMLSLCLVLGAFIGLAGVYSFKRHKTTVNPIMLEKTTSLVTSGIYRYTRNPMYLGLLLWLLAFAVYLSSLVALIGPVLFVLYMNEFQIKPEESVLSAKFGQEFTRYTQEVRRWL